MVGTGMGKLYWWAVAIVDIEFDYCSHRFSSSCDLLLGFLKITVV